MKDLHRWVKVDYVWEAQKQVFVASSVGADALITPSVPPLTRGSNIASKGREFLSHLKSVSPEAPGSFIVELETLKHT